MNYKQIQDLLAFYAHRTDLVDYYDSIFSMTTDFIANRVRLMAMETTTILTTLDGIVDLPLDFLEARNVARVDGDKRHGLNFYTVRGFDKFNLTARGLPSGYAIIANRLHVAAQSDNLEIELNYFARPAALVNDGDTNAILTKHSSLYLYGALMYAASAIQDSETQQVSAEQFNTELAIAEDADTVARNSGDTPQMRSV